MTNEEENKPVTLGQVRELLQEQEERLQKHLRIQLTSHLARFYTELIEPRFEQIDRRFDGIDARLDEHDQRFDDIYKKIEDLRQEYVVSNEQISRLEKKISSLIH